MSKNHIAEWYGHRVYPVVAASPEALADQRARRCSFLSDATGQTRQCVKAPTSQGVCSVSSLSNGPRQDWLVCPFRALDDALLDDVVRRLFGYGMSDDVTLLAAPSLAGEARREQIREAVASGRPAVVYFQSKLGGEITVPRTERSPELSLDATLAELLPPAEGQGLRVGRYGIFEVQTMDYHGSYTHAVNALNGALDLHGEQFHQILAGNAEWLAPAGAKPPAWIYVFDIDVSATDTPNLLTLWRVIGTDAGAVAHYALDVAPQAALEEGSSVDRILLGLRRRLAEYLPEVPLPEPAQPKRSTPVLPPLEDAPPPSSPAVRASMRANRRRDTTPERRLRSHLHALGYRFRVDFPIDAPPRAACAPTLCSPARGSRCSWMAASGTAAPTMAADRSGIGATGTPSSPGPASATVRSILPSRI